jgi:chromosome segregation ATPase
MKEKDYIDSLIKEKESLKEQCKLQSETIRLLRREVIKRDRRNAKIEKESIASTESTVSIDSINEELKNELYCVKNDLYNLKIEYDSLQLKNNEILKEKDNLQLKCNKISKENSSLKNKYNKIVKENEELKQFLDEISKMCDSE